MEPFIGQIQAFGFSFAPRGWAKCDGQLLAISQYQSLFSLLGTVYGGDGRTTFALPDLRSRSIVGEGTGPGLDNVRLGEKSGSYQITLNTNHMPAHNHTFAVSTAAGEEAGPDGQYIASHGAAFSESPTANKFLGANTVGQTGGGQAFNNRNPYLGINVCIALEGIYPSRN